MPRSTLFIRLAEGYLGTMDPDQLNPASHEGARTVSAAAIMEMLACLQEAVVTSEAQPRRALLKGVIARLQDVLAASGPA